MQLHRRELNIETLSSGCFCRCRRRQAGGGDRLEEATGWRRRQAGGGDRLQEAVASF